MTDQEKLREYITLYEGFPAQEMQDWLKTLRRIASLLDAVPPETLEALKAGTWVAVPKKPSLEMCTRARKEHTNEIRQDLMRNDDCRIIYRAMLAAAPAKPEG